jgi:pSer/pThr/pTyr-binding forkhead associated (FHA) protein
VPESPLDAHVATPQQLRDRIAAERRGTPFLVYRDVDDEQAIVDLEAGGERITIGRRPGNEVVLDWDSEVSRVHAALERLGD